MDMKTLALALAAAATLAFTAPSFAASAAPDRIQLAQADVKVRIGDRDHDRGDRREHRMHREVRMHRDYDRHEGWRHRHHDGQRTVIIKKHRDGQRTVIKKKIEG
jgi:hypothetical protein